MSILIANVCEFFGFLHKPWAFIGLYKHNGIPNGYVIVPLVYFTILGTEKIIIICYGMVGRRVKGPLKAVLFRRKLTLSIVLFF